MHFTNVSKGGVVAGLAVKSHGDCYEGDDIH